MFSTVCDHVCAYSSSKSISNENSSTKLWKIQNCSHHAHSFLEEKRKKRLSCFHLKCKLCSLKCWLMYKNDGGNGAQPRFNSHSHSPFLVLAIAWNYKKSFSPTHACVTTSKKTAAEAHDLTSNSLHASHALVFLVEKNYMLVGYSVLCSLCTAICNFLLFHF